MFVDRHNPPYRTAGAVLVVITAVVAGLIYMQFRGDFTDKTELTLLSSRAGLVVEPGAKVTYNGVEIGRVGRIGTVDVDGKTKARLSLDVDPDYIEFIPANVVAEIQATTVFGNKYVSFSSPDDPTAERISSSHVIDVSSVSTEFNTLFETVMALAEQVDPIKLNRTLTATAEALTGLGDRFGESLTNGNSILDDLNARMPQIREDTGLVADLVDVYADASPDLWEGLRERGDHRAHIQRAPGRHRRGVDGRARLRRLRGRQFRPRRTVFRPRCGRSGAHDQAVRLLQPHDSSARSGTSPRSRSESPRRSVETATRWRRRRARSRARGTRTSIPTTCRG